MKGRKFRRTSRRRHGKEEHRLLCKSVRVSEEGGSAAKNEAMSHEGNTQRKGGSLFKMPFLSREMDGCDPIEEPPIGVDLRDAELDGAQKFLQICELLRCRKNRMRGCSCVSGGDKLLRKTRIASERTKKEKIPMAPASGFECFGTLTTTSQKIDHA